MFQTIKKFLYVFLNLLIGRKLPNDDKNNNIIVLHELRDKLNDFRMNNGLLPYFYNNFLEEIAQEKCNKNYMSSKVDDSFSKTTIQIRLKMHHINCNEICLLSVRSTNGVEGFYRELVSNQKYRGAILNGYLNSVGMAKCENFICILLTD